MRFITQEQRDDDIAAAIESREMEIANYEMNEANYEKILATYADLQEAWPESIKSLKGKQSHDVAAMTDDATFDLFNQYSHRDQVRLLLKTTRAERAKSQRVLDALEASLTPERADAAISRAKTRKQTPEFSRGV